MAEIRWTLQAADDFEAIIEFVSKDSPPYARMLAIDITDAVEQIGVFPQSGRIVPEIGSPDYRELILGNYRIIYRVQSDLVQILTLHHTARLFDPRQLNR